MLASPSATVSSPGSGLPPYSMNSIMSSWARDLISSPSRDPTLASPPPTEYATSALGYSKLAADHEGAHAGRALSPLSSSLTRAGDARSSRHHLRCDTQA